MTDHFTAMRQQAAVTTAKAETLDALMKALVLGTGEYKKLLAKAKADYQAPARDRIEKRRENNERH